MPVATFIVAVIFSADKLRVDVLLIMILISVGVVVASYGEIEFNVIGTMCQLTGILCEALKLVLTQVLLQKRGLTLNPVTSLYYIAPCSFLFLLPPWLLLEKPTLELSQIRMNLMTFFSNAFCALALNIVMFLVIGRSGAVTFRVAGVLKDWLLISLSMLIFPDYFLTKLNVIGYAIALSGVVMYQIIKARDSNQHIETIEKGNKGQIHSPTFTYHNPISQIKYRNVKIIFSDIIQLCSFVMQELKLAWLLILKFELQTTMI